MRHRSGRSSAASERRLKGEPDEKPIGPSARSQAECCPERITLGRREPLETSKHRGTQLVETGERKLHLRLHSDGLQNPAAFRALRGVSK
jgi:hypothetical protein